MTEKYTIALDIASYMADRHKRLRPVYFMCLAQELALKGADALNFGYASTSAQDAAWVLSRMHVKFINTPHWQDDVVMRTWHKGLRGLLFRRDFEMMDKDGKPAVLATSSWVLMNTKDRRLIRPDRYEGFLPDKAQYEGSALEEDAPKVTMPKDAEAVKVRSHQVHFSDVDFIGHTNNTKYIEWASDCVPEEIMLDYPVKDLMVNYIQESKLDDVIDLYLCPPVEDGEDRHYIIEGRHEDRPIFICEFVF